MTIESFIKKLKEYADVNIVQEGSDIDKELDKYFNNDRNCNYVKISDLLYHSNTITFIIDKHGVYKKLLSNEIRHNTIDIINRNRKRIEDIVCLKIGDSNLSELPYWIQELKSLSSLEVSNNNLNVLPDFLQELKNLSYLDVGRNKLTVFPDFFKELKNLSYLNVSYTNLNVLPDFFKELKNLSTLDVSFNNLNVLPDFFKELKNLSYLDVGNNNLNVLPDSLRELKNLSYLNVRKNNLNVLPDFFKELKNLSTLDVSFNNLNVLPDSLQELKNLSTLDVSKNNLNVLPDSLQELKNLSTLYVDSNNLNVLPDSLQELKNLSTLDVSFNNIKSLDRWVFEKDWSVSSEFGPSGISIGDKIQTPPKEVIESGKENVLKWFDKNRAPIKEMRVILLGEAEAGKTSLVKALTGEPHDKDEPTTHGINIKKYDYDDLTINYWDFGGQDIMFSTHKFFLSEDCIYIVVIDSRKDELPEKWLKQIESFGKSSDTFIVANKIDENKNIAVPQYEQYNFIVDTFKVSCREHYRIDFFKQEFIQYIKDHNSYKKEYPVDWINIKSAIENNPDDFISLDAYKKICEVNHVLDIDEQNNLLTVLHHLGTIQHFEDIEDKQILKSEYITEAVYAIVTSDKYFDKKCGIHKDDIIKILNEKGIDSRPQVSQIIEIMKRYQLCYENLNGRIIMPIKLGVKQDYNYKKSDDLLKIYYDYNDFIDESILHKIIVSLHDKIYKEIVWRKGVVLDYSENCGCMAEIIMDEIARKIYISIWTVSDFCDKRNVLFDIRQTIDRINLEYYKVVDSSRYKCMIPIINSKGQVISDEGVEYSELINMLKNNDNTYTNRVPYEKINIYTLLGYIETIEKTNESVNKERGVQQMKSETHIHVEGDYIDQKHAKGNTFGRVENSKVKAVNKDSFNKTKGLDFDINELFSAMLNQKLDDELREDIEDLKDRIEECKGQYTAKQKNRFARLFDRIKNKIGETISLQNFADGITVANGIAKAIAYFSA